MPAQYMQKILSSEFVQVQKRYPCFSEFVEGVAVGISTAAGAEEGDSTEVPPPLRTFVVPGRKLFY